LKVPAAVAVAASVIATANTRIAPMPLGEVMDLPVHSFSLSRPTLAFGGDAVKRLSCDIRET
jgi:hypothetical protein